MGSAGQCEARCKNMRAAEISEKKLYTIILPIALQIFTKNLEKIKN